MSVFGRKRAAGAGAARLSPVASPAVGLPKSTSAASCECCQPAQEASAFGLNHGTVTAQMLVYCLNCGASWLTSAVGAVPLAEPAAESTARLAV